MLLQIGCMQIVGLRELFIVTSRNGVVGMVAEIGEKVIVAAMLRAEFVMGDGAQGGGEQFVMMERKQ